MSLRSGELPLLLSLVLSCSRLELTSLLNSETDSPETLQFPPSHLNLPLSIHYILSPTPPPSRPFTQSILASLPSPLDASNPPPPSPFISPPSYPALPTHTIGLECTSPKDCSFFFFTSLPRLAELENVQPRADPYFFLQSDLASSSSPLPRRPFAPSKGLLSPTRLLSIGGRSDVGRKGRAETRGWVWVWSSKAVRREEGDRRKDNSRCRWMPDASL